MLNALLSGIFWGADTSFMGYYFSMYSIYFGVPLLFPVFITFIHDMVSALLINISILVTGRFNSVIEDIKKAKSKYIWLGSLLGGPIGMCSFILAIEYAGPAITAIVSSIYPAVGFFFAYIFLKERRRPYQVIALFIAIAFIIALGFSDESHSNRSIIGIIFALVCACAWGSEAVLCSYGMKSGEISNLSAICIRQNLSMITYGMLLTLYFVFFHYGESIDFNSSLAYIGIAAIFGSTSYYCYYRALATIGVSRGMALNISYTAFSAIFSYLLFGIELTTNQMLIGFCIVVSGLVSAYDFEK
uniref:DMT family transporter n=1 Tax=uncultured Veillonella sp. TaxID=159268 RepID=UPI0025DC3494|nr:DMT family transporter [uncultured Veillonella sp.]